MIFLWLLFEFLALTLKVCFVLGEPKVPVITLFSFILIEVTDPRERLKLGRGLVDFLETFVLHRGQVWTSVTLVQETPRTEWFTHRQLGLDILVSFSTGLIVDTRSDITRVGRIEILFVLTLSIDFAGEYIIFLYSGSACFF